MNVTFLIGNGFDRALGLDTDYPHFLNHYVFNIKNDDPDIKQYKKYLIEEKNNNIKNWSDAELLLGQMTDYYHGEDENKFYKLYKDERDALSDYLKRQENRVTFTDENKIIKVLEKLFYSYKEYLHLNEKNLFVNKYYNQEFHFHFINYNYTLAFDKCIDLIKSKNMFSHRNIANNTFNDRIIQIVHLHGTVGKNMIFGVSDPSQVLNKHILENELLKICLLKSVTDIQNNDGLYNRVTTAIDDSRVICIFGMSYGDTDKFWWDKIELWLKKSPENQLVLFDFNNEFIDQPDYRWIEKENIKNQLFKNSKSKKEELDKLNDQIHLVIGDIFNGYKLIKEQSTSDETESEAAATVAPTPKE